VRVHFLTDINFPTSLSLFPTSPFSLIPFPQFPTFIPYMPYKEKETEKLYYSIGEVAKMFNVNASLIRFWEKEFDIIKPQKNRKGNRSFTAADIDNFRRIFHLVKERGYTLQGAKEKLRQNKDEVFNEVDMIVSLERVKSFLLELKKSL
jgi:DNA-binding transcriptional MerR regulator